MSKTLKIILLVTCLVITLFFVQYFISSSKTQFNQTTKEDIKYSLDYDSSIGHNYVFKLTENDLALLLVKFLNSDMCKTSYKKDDNFFYVQTECNFMLKKVYVFKLTDDKLELSNIKVGYLNIPFNKNNFDKIYEYDAIFSGSKIEKIMLNNNEISLNIFSDNIEEIAH